MRFLRVSNGSEREIRINTARRQPFLGPKRDLTKNLLGYFISRQCGIFNELLREKYAIPGCPAAVDFVSHCYHSTSRKWNSRHKKKSLREWQRNAWLNHWLMNALFGRTPDRRKSFMGSFTCSVIWSAGIFCRLLFTVWNLIIIGLIMVFEAILTGVQSGQKLQCLYGYLMANNK